MRDTGATQDDGFNCGLIFPQECLLQLYDNRKRINDGVITEEEGCLSNRHLSKKKLEYMRYLWVIFISKLFHRCEHTVPYGYAYLQTDDEMKNSWIEEFSKRQKDKTLPSMKHRHIYDALGVVWKHLRKNPGLYDPTFILSLCTLFSRQKHIINMYSWRKRTIP